MSSRIRAARTERDWSQTRLILELERVAGRRGTRLPSRQTLKSRVSRWENGHAVPDEFYRQLLREVFGLDDRELGFEYRPDDRVVTAAEDLRLSLVAALEADDHLVEVLRSQTQAIRMQDRQFGAGTLLEVARGHVAGIERHVSHAVVERMRRLLAEELADASALAGWQAMDVGAQDQAWRFFELSAAAALRADDRSLFAFARLEQAHLVSELAGTAVAAKLASSIWSEAHRRVSAPMRCWMAAAVAELQAVDEPAASRRMLERAESLIDAVDEAPPYVVLDRTHLARWSGHTLVLMQDPGAEQLLLQAEASMPRTFIRAQASLNLDLAVAIARRGDQEAAVARMTKANELARRVGSRRLLARLEALRAAS